MTSRAALLAVLATLCAGPALAQDADPIGDLLGAPEEAAAPAAPPADPAPALETAPPPSPEVTATAGPVQAEAPPPPAAVPQPPPVAAAPVETPAAPAAVEAAPAAPAATAMAANEATSDEEETAAAELVTFEPPVEPATPTAAAVAAFAPPPAAPAPAYTPPPPRPTYLDRQTHLSEVGVAPDGPPTQRDLVYESRVKNTFNAAQGVQGPLDGRWALADQASGATLYIFQLVDPPRGGALEGVWRDPRRPPGVGQTGLISDLQREGGHLTVTFTPISGANAVTVVLNPVGDGSWIGEIQHEGRSQSVLLRRY